MTQRKNNGGPAHPTNIRTGKTNPGGGPEIIAHPGMTLRDWFAGKFLAGIAANPAMVNRHGTKTSWSYGEDAWSMEQFAKDMSGYAYDVADAMLEERSK